MKVKPEQASECKIRDGPYGIPNPFVEGLTAAKTKLRVSHPLEASERNVSTLQKSVRRKITSHCSHKHELKESHQELCN